MTQKPYFAWQFLTATALVVAVNVHTAWAQQIPATIHSVSSNLADVTAFDRTADYVVNGAGLVGDTHSIVPDGTMWLNIGTFAAPNDLEPEITFDLGSVQSVSSMKVWNYNETLAGRPELLGRGVGVADILIAGEDLVFAPLISGHVFTVAPGLDNVDFGEVVDLNADARYVKLDIGGNLGGDASFVGLSEVQFFGVPEPSTGALAAALLLLPAFVCRRRRR